jgi:hypothetical protein
MTLMTLPDTTFHTPACVEVISRSVICVIEARTPQPNEGEKTVSYVCPEHPSQRLAGPRSACVRCVRDRPPAGEPNRQQQPVAAADPTATVGSF